jgi:hypothetical protein
MVQYLSCRGAPLLLFCVLYLALWLLLYVLLCCMHPLVQVFAQQHPLVLKLEADVMAKVLSCSEPLDSQGSQQDAAPSS